DEARGVGDPRTLGRVPQLAEAGEGAAQEEHRQLPPGGRAHAVHWPPAPAPLELAPRARLQDLATVGVGGDQRIPIVDLAPRGRPHPDTRTRSPDIAVTVAHRHAAITHLVRLAKALAVPYNSAVRGGSHWRDDDGQGCHP